MESSLFRIWVLIIWQRYDFILLQKDLRSVARERVYELLKKDEVVPLPDDLDQEVNGILDAAAAELVK